MVGAGRRRVDLSTNRRGIWTFPIETISQSEAGYELVHQSSVVVPHWRVEVGDEGRWEVRIALAVDTSIAKARELAESGMVAG